MGESTLTAEPEPRTVPPAGLRDVRAVPLGRLAQQGADAGLERVLPGIGTVHIAACTFQSSI
jgi:hypothetical protein